MDRKILFLTYLAECAIGVCLGFYFFHLSAEVGAWILVSTVMVLAPDREEAIKFGFNRIKANMAGAVAGLILALIHPMNMYVIALGVLLAASVCELLNLRSAMRSATVGVVLISLAPAGRFFMK